MRRRAKVDENQPEIVAALRAVGAWVLPVHQLKNAFDVLVGYRGGLFIMEIKNGELPPSQRRLTEGEEKCKRDVEKSGNKYNVVENIEEAMNVISK